ncbi:MAG TPA: discoidin domain-containing protein [Actinopolymorphaceae bacterium]|jgi:hypothetical protein
MLDDLRRSAPRSPAKARVSGRALVAATLTSLLVATVPSIAASPAAYGAAGPTTAAVNQARPSIVLSSQPDSLTTRQCLTETLKVGITNQSAESTFVNLSISPDEPIWTANPRISTYVPANSTVTVSIQIYVPEDAADGDYTVRMQATPTAFGAAPRSRLAVPVTVSAPAGRRCIPRSAMTVTASSAQEPENAPAKAIDGATATIWHAQYRPERTFLPQWITFDLGGSYDVAELWYQPRVDGNLNGTIMEYTVLASTDGTNFTEVTAGTWARDATRKIVEFNAPGARYIRLLATEGVSDYASAAEIALFGRSSSG